MRSKKNAPFIIWIVTLIATFSILYAENIPGITRSKEWKVYYSKNLSFDTAAALRYDDDEYVAVANDVPIKPVIIMDGTTFDLGKNRKFNMADRAAMVGAIYSDAPKSIYIGMGADWWIEAFCNGKFIGGCDELGNDNWPASPQDHIFKFDLRKGRNDIVIRVSPGLASWNATIDFFSTCNDPDLPPRRLVAPGIAFGPYLTNPGSTSATITYLLNGRQPMSLEYRRKGESKWNKVEILRGGQIIDETPVLHFNLTGLQPDSTYEYRGLLYQLPCYQNFITDKVHTFKTYSNATKEFNFFVMGDTHDNQKRMKLARLRKLFNAKPELLKSDFFVHVGDLYASGAIDNFRNDVFDTMFKLVPPEVYLLPIRGNHEFEGPEGQQWLEHFPYAQNKSYGLFRIGEVCFILLDTGYHRETHPNYSALNRLNTLLEEEKQWLENAVKSPEFTTAKFRIVIGHVAPTQDDKFNHMIPRLQYMVENVFKGAMTSNQIDLWICGHMHKYLYRKAAGEWNFPVVTLSAGEAEVKPGVVLYFQIKGEKITMTAINADGITHDKIDISR